MPGWARGKLSWGWVRTLGELQVLTRASYAMLVAVPLLAGLWPEVQAMVGRAAGFGATVETAAPSSAPGDDATGRDARDGRRPTRREPPLLPQGWALAFFAALCVTAGQLIYQARAPILVRQESGDQFVRRRRDEYARQPTPEAFREAAAILELLGSDSYHEIIFAIVLDLNRADPDPNADVNNFRQVVRERLRMLSAGERADFIASFSQERDYDGARGRAQRRLLQAYAEGINNEEPIGRLGFETDVVARAAARTYEEAARTAPLSIALAGLLYGVGLLLLLWLTYTQARAVWIAAGWPSPPW